ncbi:MAG: VCBS repeat-containing protein [Candidatus Marinimicrobia bacterium]|nr:VCBS repeat-containing protein [Candidatus Neomarinimicrobiota bacterium]
MLSRFSGCFLIFACGLLTARNLYIFGTFDFNGNGKSEILKLGGISAQLEYVELNMDGNHQTLWQYSPDSGTKVIDAKFGDLNQDGIEELIIIQRSSDKAEWLKIFEWNGQGFSSNDKSIKRSGGEADRIRPANLAAASNLFAVAMSSPSRSMDLFTLLLKDGALEKSESLTQSSSLVTNGFGPVYGGLFSGNGETFAALMSPEGNVLKTSIFSVSSPVKEIASDILVMNGARVVLGPDIQPFDENKDGREELLVPFATGEVYALALSDSGITFTESKLSQSGLFGMKSAAGEIEINNTILARVENGLYDSVLGEIQSAISDSLLLLVSDTLVLGDTLNLFVLPDTNSTFYSFGWRTTPPSGMRFNPNVYQIEWVPTRDHIGVVDVSYALNIREGEELMSGEDALGDTHHIRPVLQAHDSSMVILVGDTIKPPEPFVLIPPRFHRVSVSTKDIDEKDRFVFEGETPFSTSSINVNDVISIGVSADLSTIKHDKTAAFNFKSSANKPDSLVSLSLIHDLDSNILYSSIFPPQDTIPQSFDAEGFNSNLYLFPEYFFEGFPSNMNLDSTNTGGLLLLTSDEKISGTISLSSPLHNQDHNITISYFGGRPYAIRGDINVKENGSHKTITEIDFESSFVPRMINAWLTPAERDTFVFHTDSIPDTLKANVEFRSFYSSATKLKDKTPPGIQTDSSQPADTTATIPGDKRGVPLDTLSIVPPAPSAVVSDSIKTHEPEAPADST